MKLNLLNIIERAIALHKKYENLEIEHPFGFRGSDFHKGAIAALEDIKLGIEKGRYFLERIDDTQHFIKEDKQ